MVRDEEGSPEDCVETTISHFDDEGFLALDYCETIDEDGSYSPLKGRGSEFNGYSVGIVITPKTFRTPIVIT
ncbi:MAG: hypothetical protein QW796_00630 [Thermoproteota archaeon]